MTELILGPVTGGLSHKRANLWGRAGGPGTLYAWLGRSPDLQDAWLVGQSMPLSAQDGFAGVAPISGLSPDTQYYYDLTLENTPPDPAGAPYPKFITFPLPGQPRPFTFAFGSCFRPADENGGKIFYQLEKRRKLDQIRFCLLIGDQIYADDYNYNGLGTVACNLTEYRSVYEYTFSRPPFRQLLKNLPVFMTLDDHEVDDDWTWTDMERTTAQIPVWDRIERCLRRRSPWEWQIPAQRVKDALQAYWEHQAMHAPALELPPRIDYKGQYALASDDHGSFAYTFTFGAAAFFVMDTRSMRIKNRQCKSMLGEGQWRAMEAWLLAVKDDYPVKFIISSCCLLFQMWADIPRDRWSGFPDERKRLLYFLAAHGIQGVYLLTGDLHSAHAVSVELYGPHGRGLELWEFCASPFEQAPNWFSKLTYQPLPVGLVKDQKLHFNLNQHNFGVVRVDFNDEGMANVCFEVYGSQGELLGKAGG